MAETLLFQAPLSTNLTPSVGTAATTFARVNVASYQKADGTWDEAVNGAPAYSSRGGISRYKSDSALICPLTALAQRDLTQSGWIKTNSTAAKTQTGIKSDANTASLLTATANDATAFYPVTLAAAVRTFSAFVKRVAGTGAVSITRDGGTTYTDITSQINSSTWTRVTLTSTVTDPSIGFKLAVSGDAIAIDAVNDTATAQMRSPLITQNNRNADNLTFVLPSAIDATKRHFLRAKLTPTGGILTIVARNAANNSAAQFQFDTTTGVLTGATQSAGTFYGQLTQANSTTLGVPLATLTAGVEYTMGIEFLWNNVVLTVNGARYSADFSKNGTALLPDPIDIDRIVISNSSAEIRDLEIGTRDAYSVCFEGDSIIADKMFTNTLIAQRPSLDYVYCNRAFAGSTIATGSNQVATRVATNVTPHYRPSALRNILLLWVGTNSLGGNPNVAPADAATQYQAYVSEIIANGPNWKIQALTVLPRTGLFTAPMTAAAWPAAQGQLNTAIKAMTGIAKVTDVAAIPALTPASNTTYYGDGLHLIQAGYDVLMPSVATDMQSLATPLVPGTLSAPTGATTTSITGIVWTSATGGSGTKTNQLQSRLTSGVDADYVDVAGQTAIPGQLTGLTASTTPASRTFRVRQSDDTGTVYTNAVTGTPTADEETSSMPYTVRTSLVAADLNASTAPGTVPSFTNRGTTTSYVDATTTPKTIVIDTPNDDNDSGIVPSYALANPSRDQKLRVFFRFVTNATYHVRFRETPLGAANEQHDVYINLGNGVYFYTWALDQGSYPAENKNGLNLVNGTDYCFEMTFEGAANNSTFTASAFTVDGSGNLTPHLWNAGSNTWTVTGINGYTRNETTLYPVIHSFYGTPTSYTRIEYSDPLVVEEPPADVPDAWHYWVRPEASDTASTLTFSVVDLPDEVESGDTVEIKIYQMPLGTYVSSSVSGGTLVATINASQSPYKLTGLSADTYYNYVAVARINGAGDSYFSTYATQAKTKPSPLAAEQGNGTYGLSASGPAYHVAHIGHSLVVGSDMTEVATQLAIGGRTVTAGKYGVSGAKVEDLAPGSANYNIIKNGITSDMAGKAAGTRLVLGYRIAINNVLDSITATNTYISALQTLITNLEQDLSPEFSVVLGDPFLWSKISPSVFKTYQSLKPENDAMDAYNTSAQSLVSSKRFVRGKYIRNLSSQHYEWTLDGIHLGGTGSPNQVVARADAKEWQSDIVAYEGTGPTPTAPVFTAQPPATASAVVGGTLTIPTATTGATSFQWQKAGGNVSGQTAEDFSKTNAQTSDNGTYRLLATNTTGTTTSTTCQVTVTEAPSEGGDMSFTADDRALLTSIAAGLAEVKAQVEVLTENSSGVSLQAVDIDVNKLTNLQTEFQETGRIFFHIKIEAKGKDFPEALFSLPTRIVVGPSGQKFAPVATSDNSCEASIITVDNDTIAEVFVGNEVGTGLDQLALPGSPNGTKYKVWLFVDGPMTGEKLRVPGEDITVYGAGV